LVVDDQLEMAEMIADDLCDRGYEGVAVTSARKALEMLGTDRFDLLVTDLRMPEMDGLALLHASLQLDPMRPVIMMTAHGTMETAVQATGPGAYHYLLKPFRLDVLFRLVEKALVVAR
jgi:DNA-binding NtrC family response regulator